MSRIGNLSSRVIIGLTNINPIRNKFEQLEDILDSDIDITMISLQSSFTCKVTRPLLEEIKLHREEEYFCMQEKIFPAKWLNEKQILILKVFLSKSIWETKSSYSVVLIVHIKITCHIILKQERIDKMFECFSKTILKASANKCHLVTSSKVQLNLHVSNITLIS